MTLKNKTAIVTGSAQGIGHGIAQELAKYGARVAICDINEAKAAETAQTLNQQGYAAISAYVDVSDPDSLERMMEKVAKEYGGIDVLVNNAGILDSTPVTEMSEEIWDKVMRINLKSVFFASQKALPYLKERPNPRIVNIASIAGRMGGIEAGMAYAASKGGIISLTYGLANQFARFGITVNCVCPGPTETTLIHQWTDAQIDGLRRMIPLGKLGKPRNIGSAVAYLASDEAEFITGLMMDVNGGMYFG